jgi:hypothetical protein
MLMVVGCSSSKECEPCVEVICPVLKNIEVNLSDVPLFRADVRAVEGTDRSSLPTNDLLQVKSSMKSLREQKAILESVIEFHNEQVNKFNKEFVNVND